ncbi:hypothetical protein GGU11DRAFT_504100 [Lentinula aff. detonsa]|nr:hypothetical protein GGU11DRAFT_504100 [Lentinula aff. detonsa]
MYSTQPHFSNFSLHSSSPSSPTSHYSDRLPSQISLPEARLSRYTLPEFYQPTNNSHSPYNQSPSDTYSFATTTEAELPVPDIRPRVPRPPNAFMLFRSNMLKTKAIPATAEKRQQQLSKVAGECWNLLSPEEKQVWHDEAANQLREHQLKYPNYKFTPAARGSSRKMKKDAGQSAKTDKDHVRELREKWTHIYGPAVTPSRRRKPKQKDHHLSKSQPDLDFESLFNDPALAVTVSSRSLPSSPASSVSDSSLPPVFPNPSYPHYSESQPSNYRGFLMNEYPFPRPPSTSSNSSCDGSVASSASSFDAPSFDLTSYSPRSDSGLCAGFSNLDITPTATSFRESDLHPQPLDLLRQPPSFISLTNERASSEPPFLSPLVPSPSELPTNFLERTAAEGTSGGPASTSFVPFSYDSLKPDESNLSSFGPFPFIDSDLADVGGWNFTGDGNYRL